MTYKGEPVDYSGECPCAEESLLDGTKAHSRGRKAIIRNNFVYGNLLAVCQNHLHNYLSSPTKCFEYIGLEETGGEIDSQLDY